MRISPKEAGPWWSWGGTITGLAGIESPEQQTEPRKYTVVFALSPYGTALFYPQGTSAQDFVGDSNFFIPEELRSHLAQPVKAPVDTSGGRITTELTMQSNSKGNLGSVTVVVPCAVSSVHAFEIAKTVLEFLSLRIALATEIPIRSDACLIIDNTESGRFAIRYCSLRPLVSLEQDHRFIPPVMQRLAAFYVDGIRANSPFYAFLCYFKLCDVLTGALQGIFRKLARERGINVENLSGHFSADNVGNFLPQLTNVSYRDAIGRYNQLRVRVAHQLLAPARTP